MLEIIQIHIEQVEQAAVPVIMQVLVQASAVVQAGQKICIGVAQNLLFQLPLHGDVPENAEFPDHILEDIVDIVLMDLKSPPGLAV